MFDFGEAIRQLKAGEKVARAGWNGKGIFVFLESVAESGNVPGGYGRFLAIDTTGLQSDNVYAPRSVVPWLASQTDMLSEDWLLID